MFDAIRIANGGAKEVSRQTSWPVIQAAKDAIEENAPHESREAFRLILLATSLNSCSVGDLEKAEVSTFEIVPSKSRGSLIRVKVGETNTTTRYLYFPPGEDELDLLVALHEFFSAADPTNFSQGSQQQCQLFAKSTGDSYCKFIQAQDLSEKLRIQGSHETRSNANLLSKIPFSSPKISEKVLAAATGFDDRNVQSSDLKRNSEADSILVRQESRHGHDRYGKWAEVVNREVLNYLNSYHSFKNKATRVASAAGSNDSNVPTNAETDSLKNATSSVGNFYQGISRSANMVDQPPQTDVVYHDDMNEIIVGIKRLVVSHDSLNTQVQQMDTKVARTQIDLDGLVTRSTNNNKHLQSLLLSTQDVRKLQELLEQLSEQQQHQQQQSQSIESKVSSDQTSSDEVQRLRQELDLYKQQHGNLVNITAELSQKQQELTVVNSKHEQMISKLHDSRKEFEKLRSEHKELDAQIDHALFSKCKAVETNLAISAANFMPPNNSSDMPMTKMNRITNMLRKNNPNGRRVMSLNVAGSSTNYTPSNNSDDNNEEP
ncbi:LANO_0H11496g1_1 [Lachancea nothofagi CBS 11611]|uniref:LANO_0H11496g1_1 n=1 Tax=Lachancea nothofagi CBS 11611 TaxID=1266666 RepID=A0A1G4KMB3_9SACH|nr:LANO_0H11496g1_1 [Lachancea nothofagi CBS 11611]